VRQSCRTIGTLNPQLHHFSHDRAILSCGWRKDLLDASCRELLARDVVHRSPEFGSISQRSSGCFIWRFAPPPIAGRRTPAMPNEDPLNASAFGGYVMASLTSHILEKCGDELIRDNILKRATALNSPLIGMLRRGVSIRTSPDNYLPYTAARLTRFDGTMWVAIGDPIPLK
jgi:hypothetical protein